MLDATPDAGAAWQLLSAAWPWLAAGAAVAAASAVAWLALRRRARRPTTRRRRRAPHAVVLAHGLFGFDELRLGGARHRYFRGVSERLLREGCVVHAARVAGTASIADRAAELAAFVDALPARRVTLVAHSMGGLDARYALARLGLASRVAALVTVGTPHRGTPIADLGDGLARRTRAWSALERVGVNVDAFRDLTSARMAEFNGAVPDARGVVYASVVGAPLRRRDVTPLLVPTWAWLGRGGGPNDGVVPATSQRWGEVVWEVGADHLAQIGWSRRFDAAELYATLVRALRARGL